MSAENFTYTGSPWGYTAPGWTVFQRSPGISPKAAEALMSYFRYPGPPEGPVRFVYVGVTPSGQRVLAQSRDSGLRWYDESRGHDYFAHVFVEPASAALPPEFNPMALYMSSGRDGIQTEFPAELKKKALDILKGLRAKEEPPPLAAFDSLSSLPANPAFDKYGLFEPDRLPPGTVAKLPSIVAAVASRVADPDRHPMVLFDVSNRRSLDVMAATMALLPPALRHSASFATYASSDEIASSSPLGAFAFAGVARQGSGGDPDTGVVGELPDAGFAFADMSDALLFASIADAIQTTAGMAAFNAARCFYTEALVARSADVKKKGANMANGTIDGADYSSISKDDVARVVDTLTMKGIPARDILVKAVQAAEKKAFESQAAAVEKLRAEHSRRERQLMEEVRTLSGGGVWKIATVSLLVVGILFGGVATLLILSKERENESQKAELAQCDECISNLTQKVEGCKSDHDKVTADYNSLLKTNDVLRADCNTYRNDLKNCYTTNAIQICEISNLSNRIEGLKRKLEDANKLYIDATNQLFTVTNNASAAKSFAKQSNEIAHAANVKNSSHIVEVKGFKSSKDECESGRSEGDNDKDADLKGQEPKKRH